MAQIAEPEALRTEVTPLPDSRVRVQAEVSAPEVERRLQQKARELGRGMRLPGFRKGKVPAPLVLQRLGRESVLDETVREQLPRWYAEAVRNADLDTVGDPKIELSGMPSQGESLTFTLEIGVQPVATLGDIRGLEVPRREPAADPEAVAREIDELRERMAKLDSVDEPATDGDFVVMDYRGFIDGEPFAGGEGRDQAVELASGRMIPGFEEGLQGVRAGEQREIEVAFPDDYGTAELAGRPARFEVSVRDVKRKRLPELDEEFAAEAGFDDLDELRQDVERRLLEADERRVSIEFREAAIDAAVAGATIDVPPALAEAHARELWEQTLHSLSHQGIGRDTYLKISGRSEEEIVAEAIPEAERALRRDAVVAAIIESEAISPSDEEILEALEPLAEREGTPAPKLFDRLRSSGQLARTRRELAAQQAVDLLVAQARPISVESAAAREKLWTPEKESGSTPSPGLWTPDS